MKKKRLGTVNIHSSVDIITNSSTELFCSVTGEEKVIKKILDDILKDFGCTAVDFSVYEYEDEDTYEVVPNRWDISYDYEMHHEPCKMILNKIKEVLNIVEEYD